MRSGVPVFIDCPLADLVPRHLELVVQAMENTAFTGHARSALELFRACLEHRFRFDVELGDAVRLKAGEHEISL